MKIAYIVFNKITFLDFVGVYDPLCRLRAMNYMPNLTWDICSITNDVVDNFGLKLKPNKVKNSLATYDAIIIPGGIGTRQLQLDSEFINWIKTAGEASLKVSICTGSLVLGAAGFLQGKIATTNATEYDTLKKYCKEVVKDRIVEDENVITAGAVSASIDLGLYLCNKWAGESVEKVIRAQMNYRG